jgi:site-specific recombinase XerD
MEEYEESGMNWLQANRTRVAPKTSARRLTSLKQFARWAGWGDMFKDYTPPEVPKSQPHPLPEGIEGVFRLIGAASNEKQRSLIALCGLCGCRVAEALTVRPSHFNLHEMTLTIRGKGDKTRVVPVSARAWEIMQVSVTKAFIAGDTSVVGLKDRFARRVITNLGVRAGLARHISSHDLRATFATAIYDKTLDLRLVQELLGHASSDTTEIYTLVSRTKMQEAVEF